MKFKNERSLERSLVRDFPGSKNVLEALDKAKRNKNKAPLETPCIPQEPEYGTMVDALKQITDAAEGFDFDSMDAKLRKDLSEMKTDSIEGTVKWLDSWLTVLGAGRAEKLR